MKRSQGADASAIYTTSLEALQREMSDPEKAADMNRILDRFGHVQEEYEHLGGYALESQAREVLHGLGFKNDQTCCSRSLVTDTGAGRGNRTPTVLSDLRILSPLRLPISPSRLPFILA